MEQINRASGRGRPVRCKGADGGVVIEKPPRVPRLHPLLLLLLPPLLPLLRA